MEHLNSVTLRGYVGNVRIMDVQDRKVANFSVATNFAFKNSSGESRIIYEVLAHDVKIIDTQLACENSQ